MTTIVSIDIVKPRFEQLTLIAKEIKEHQAHIIKLKKYFDDSILDSNRQAIKDDILQTSMKIAELRQEESQLNELFAAACCIVQCSTCPNQEKISMAKVRALENAGSPFICMKCWLNSYFANEPKPEPKGCSRCGAEPFNYAIGCAECKRRLEYDQAQEEENQAK